MTNLPGKPTRKIGQGVVSSLPKENKTEDKVVKIDDNTGRPLVQDFTTQAVPATISEVKWHPTPQLAYQLKNYSLDPGYCMLVGMTLRIFDLSKQPELDEYNQLRAKSLSPYASFKLLDLQTVFTDKEARRLCDIWDYKFFHPLQNEAVKSQP